jgi:FkbM family methyltransferase
MNSQNLSRLLGSAVRPSLSGNAGPLADGEAWLPAELPEIRLANASYGPMLTFAADEVIGHSIRVQGQFQEAKIDEVVAFLRRERGFSPEVFVDIGANIGTHLLHALKKTGFARAIGVEPDRRNFSLLLCNVVMNGMAARTELLNVAVSSACGRAELELSPDNFGDHRIRVPVAPDVLSLGEEQRETYEVATETLPAILDYCQVPYENSLMWMDTQGHEGHILASLTHPAKFARTGAALIEFWPYGLERAGGRKPYFEFLARCSAVYDINSAGWGSKAESISALAAAYDRMLADTRANYYPHTDLLCIV